MNAAESFLDEKKVTYIYIFSETNSPASSNVLFESGEKALSFIRESFPLQICCHFFACHFCSEKEL